MNKVASRQLLPKRFGKSLTPQVINYALNLRLSRLLITKAKAMKDKSQMVDRLEGHKPKRFLLQSLE